LKERERTLEWLQILTRRFLRRRRRKRRPDKAFFRYCVFFCLFDFFVFSTFLSGAFFWAFFHHRKRFCGARNMGAGMKQALVTIVGPDRPGIVHQVSQILAGQGCRILTVSQTTLLGRFAGLFAVQAPEELTFDRLSEEFGQKLEGQNLSYWIAPPEDESLSTRAESEPYVLTILGPDRLEIIPEVTKTVASFDANIENLRAVALGGVSADAAPLALVLEITVPVAVQQNVFRQALSLTAEELGIDISLQHRDIFEAIHRV
jgi:glycine cleavage system transcriptional repressor